MGESSGIGGLPESFDPHLRRRLRGWEADWAGASPACSLATLGVEREIEDIVGEHLANRWMQTGSKMSLGYAADLHGRIRSAHSYQMSAGAIVAFRTRRGLDSACSLTGNRR